MDRLPAIPLRELVLFPGMLQVLPIGRATTVAAVRAHTEGEPLVLVPQRDPEFEDPLSAELSTVGVLGQVLRLTELPDGTQRLLVEGMERVVIRSELTIEDGMTRIAAEQVASEIRDPIEVAAKARELVALHREIANTSGGLQPDEHQLLLDNDNHERVADQVVSSADLSFDIRLAVLEELVLDERMDKLLHELELAVAQQRISSEVNAKVQQAMDRSQREYTLKEQLKAIQAELGESVGAGAEADRFAERIDELGMPDEAKKEALREVDRLRRLHMDSAEYTIARTWLETVCEIPWSKTTEEHTDLTEAQTILDEDHFGLDKVKERILEYLAVRQLNPESKGPILCFVGPPGVGKTSLGQSIARALNRSYARVALGGIKDESEIRGHRRTYVGALPGRITRALIRAGSANPVIVLDELDKVGNDFRGDPASALLEVLDPEQNNAFTDHYVDVPVDLSQAVFLATANLLDPIPPALYDRLEVIEIPGYIEEEKQRIARRFLLPKLASRHGVEGKLTITENALAKTIRDYTREAGLRDLQRQLATMHRKVARKIVEGHEKRLRITEKNVHKYLGSKRFHQELAERVDSPGVVIGLAWTPTGGDILFVEAARMPGNFKLKLTGSLGQVMKESAEAAMSWLRSHAHRYNVTPEVFHSEFHLHVPAGAIPKDGPSAGVTMVTALTSLVTSRSVKSQLAMTGEITLRGKVLPVGGVKEKVLAARRAGVKEVILPSGNEDDLEDVPKALRKELKIHLADSVDDVLEIALS